MFTHKMTLEVKGGNERIHTFTCDPESPLGEVHDVLSVMKSMVVRKIEQHDQKECDKQECCQNKEECCEEGEE